VKILVSAKNQAHTFECRPGEKILYAGLRSGLGLPYECGSGTCGTCKARLREGKIEDPWPEAPGRGSLKPDSGEFLMCQCSALTDCSLEVAVNVTPMPPGACVPLHLDGVVRHSQPLTHDVVLVDLDVAPPLDFEAGQFVLMDVSGIPGRRAYSMVNFDRQARRLRFVIKKKPGGRVSEWVFGTSVEGAAVGLFGPLGNATFSPDIATHILCIAGGSGIAGMMSILSRACQERYFERSRGDLFFGVRTARDLFFLDDLSEFTAQFPETLQITLALSDEDVPATVREARPEFAFDTGFVHEVTARHMKGKFDNVRAYVAGPPPMVDASLRMLLKEGRVSPTNIRYDKFS
jgi:toluene monooxygenase electron transfer component